MSHDRQSGCFPSEEKKSITDGIRSSEQPQLDSRLWHQPPVPWPIQEAYLWKSVLAQVPLAWVLFSVSFTHFRKFLNVVQERKRAILLELEIYIDAALFTIEKKMWWESDAFLTPNMSVMTQQDDDDDENKCFHCPEVSFYDGTVIFIQFWEMWTSPLAHVWFMCVYINFALPHAVELHVVVFAKAHLPFVYPTVVAAFPGLHATSFMNATSPGRSIKQTFTLAQKQCKVSFIIVRWLQTHEGRGFTTTLKPCLTQVKKKKKWMTLDQVYLMFSRTSQPFIKDNKLEREVATGAHCLTLNCDSNSVSLPSLDCAARAHAVCVLLERTCQESTCFEKGEKALLNRPYCVQD